MNIIVGGLFVPIVPLGLIIGEIIDDDDE